MKNQNTLLALVVAMLLSFCHSAIAVTYTVNSLADPGTGSANSGSLRYCINQANATAGLHTISFTGLAAGGTITLNSELPAITRGSVILDATTTTGYVANQPGIHIDATGLNYGFLVTNAPQVKFYGFEIFGADIGIHIGDDFCDGFVIGDVNKRNFINRCSSWQIKVTGADNGMIRNNYIGCNTAGTAGYSSTGSGIFLVDGANETLVGGSSAGQGNLIAGGTGAAVYIGDYFGAPSSGSSRNVFYGNTFGGSGTDMAWWSWVFWVDGNSDENVIGGIQSGEGNVMRFGTNGNTANGYGNLVIGINESNATGNNIQGNDMHGAYGNGIVLASGSNNSQAKPVINAQNGNILSGTSSPNAVIDLYRGSYENSVYGNCKGAEYITSTLANGSGDWQVNLSSYSQFNDSMVVATATDANNGTSEFSDCFGPLQLQAGASPVCNSGGNVVIFSNYDGGFLNINVDQNIPNLKVGITTYEKTQITFSGPYVGNITEVIYAGYDGQNNHCTPSPAGTSISGVPSNITTIYTVNTNLAAASLQDSDGYPYIICSYTCDTSVVPGGCNTPEQIVHYYLTEFGGTLYSHFTQYGCWGGTYSISNGGNCCAAANILGCPAPGAAGAITGSTSVCSGQNSINYSISAVANATGYNWTLPTGASIISGSGTNQITVNFGNNATSGTVSVTPTNNCGNGTTATLSVSVTATPVAGAIQSTPSFICEGDSAVLTLSGSSHPIEWQSSVNSSNYSPVAGATDTTLKSNITQSTYYRAIAKNGSCADTSLVYQLVVHPLPTSPALSSTDTLICSGDSSEICINGSFAAYQWNNGDTSSCIFAGQAGGYWATVTDQNGCSNLSGRQNISVNPVPSVSIILSGDTLASLPAAAYQWLKDGVEISGATGQVYVAQEGGLYTLQITDANGCKAVSAPIVITGLMEYEEHVLTIFPNPTNEDFFSLSFSEDWLHSNLEIFDGNGRLIWQQTIREINMSVTTPLSKGIYLLRIQSDKASVTRKLVRL